MTVRLLATLALLWLSPSAMAERWSDAARDLAQRAESEFPGRLVAVASLAEAEQRGLPADALKEFRAAETRLFRATSLRGVVVPFRRHLFDEVRCAIYVPAGGNAAAEELWGLAHEIGHCVARLQGWQESLWTDRSLDVRHRVESWADAFATLVVPVTERDALSAMALQRRAHLGGDAAYMTERAIRCGLLAAPRAGATLAQAGEQVEALLQAECLADAAFLHATSEFLSTVR